MDFEERFAIAVLKAQDIREKSLDKDKVDKHATNEYFDFSTCYKLTMHEAADKAAELLGFDTRMTSPIYLLCESAWNDIQDWAKEITIGKKQTQKTN